MNGAIELDCGRARSLLADYLEDRLRAAEWRAVRLHLASCRACRGEAAARDPLQILAPLSALSADGLPERHREEFWAGIESQLAQLPARSDADTGVVPRLARIWALRPARAAVLAGAAAALVIMVGALLAPRLLDRDAVEPAPTIAHAQVAGIPFGQMAMEASGPAPQTVEQVRTPGSRQVQVYSMKYYLTSASAGGTDRLSPPVTELVLIVDEGLDL